MTENSKYTSKATLAVIFSLAWPTMVEELLGTAVQYVDTVMVSSLGTRATAAVGGTTTINWLVWGTVSAIGVGFLSQIARSYGAGDRRQAKKITAQAVSVTFAVGIIFTVITLSIAHKIPDWMQMDEDIKQLAGDYFFILYAPMLFRACSIIFGTALRASGDTRTPMVISVMSNVINIVLNFLLIYEPRTIVLGGKAFNIWGASMGVQGAALASAVSVVFGGIMVTIKLFRHPELSPKGESYRPDPAVLRTCFRISVPALFQRFGSSFGYVVFASMINSLGETATAAHTICVTVEELFIIPSYGMMAAAATLAGNALGARDREMSRSVTKNVIVMEAVLMTATSSLLYIFAPGLAGVFTRSPEVLGLASRILRTVAFVEPFFGVAIAIEGLLEGIGDTVTAFVCDCSTMWIIRIAGTFVAIKLMGLGLMSAWVCMMIHNFVLFVILFIAVKRGRIQRMDG